jgi:hypothetical protein
MTEQQQPPLILTPSSHLSTGYNRYDFSITAATENFSFDAFAYA